MTKITRVGLIIAVFLVGCATGGAASTMAVADATAQPEQAPGGQRWSYQCVDVTKKDTEEVTELLKPLGEQGWEAVVAGAAYTDRMICLKRAL